MGPCVKKKKKSLGASERNLLFQGRLNVTDERGLEKTFDEFVERKGHALLDLLVGAAVRRPLNYD